MTKLTAQAAGTFAIAPTPFHDDGRIDEKSIDRLTDFYAEVGCDGVTVLGILGEAPKLDAAEAEQVAVRFVKRAKNMQIIVGVSAPGFATMRSLAKASMDAGAAGVMIAPPPHLRTDDQITGYFKQAQEAIGDEIPWVLQDYPLTLNVVFTPAVIRKIVMDSPSCVMLKHEDWPGLEKISTLRGYQKDGSLKPMSILVGNGGLFLDFEMERGADGAMTGYAFPELLIDVVKLRKAGKRDAAHDLFDAHLPLIRYEQQPGAGLAVRKYVLQKRGIISSSAQRKPGATITATAKAEVEYLLSRVARVDRRANLQPQSSAAELVRWPKPSPRVPHPPSCCCATAPTRKEIEVFMMVRHYEIDFNSGALVFPGGSVDKGDKEIIATPELYSGGEGLDEATLSFRIAAIRETFEESGILLARPKGSKALVDAKRASEIEAAHRADLCDSKISFLKVLTDNGMVLALDELVPYAHWITPEGMPKRFDTWFFLAAAPPEQVGAHDGKESTDSIWVSPREALEGGESGRFKLPFPTTRNLIKLGKQPSVKAALDDSRGKSVVTVTPVMTKNNGGRQLRIPLEAGYDGEVFEVGSVG